MYQLHVYNVPIVDVAHQKDILPTVEYFKLP